MVTNKETCLYIIAIVAFIFNFVWENLHDSWYADYNIIMRRFFYFGCTLGDVFLVFFVYGLVAWIQKDLLWLKHFPRGGLLLTLVFSMVIAVLAEGIALKLQLWNYNEKMPLVPVIGIGLSPFLQITLLPALTFYITHRIFTGVNRT